MNWIESFDLLNQSMNSFCYSVSVNSNSVEKLKKELMIDFLKFFSEDLGRCAKAKATFKIKESVMSFFRLKRKVPFAAKASISKELDCLEQIGMFTKMDYREWATLTINVINKNNTIRACTDFSTRFIDCLEIYTCPLQSPGDIFVMLSDGKVFSKLDLSEAYLQIPVKECAKCLTIKML